MSVAKTKERVAASIVRARADLEQALADLEHLPEVDARAVAFAAHALGNYLAVTGGTADLLLGSLADQPDRQVRLWLEGISHATNLMTHLATELLRHASKTLSAPAQLRAGRRVRLDRARLPLLPTKSCREADQHYAGPPRRGAGRSGGPGGCGRGHGQPALERDQVLAA